MAGLAESLFPRSSRLGHLSGYHPRALLGAGLDVASLPGRAYASLGRMEDESYLDALGRTGPRYVVSQGEGDELADAILRDPLTPVGFGVGALAKGLRPILGLGADLGTNAAGMAADQYATTGSVNSAEIGAGAGMGALLGLGGMARGGKRSMISPEEREANFRNWFGDSKVVDEAGNPLVLHHGSTAQFDEFKAGEFGFHLGDESAADMFGDVKNVYLNAQNPFRIKRDMGNWRPEDMLNSLRLREYKGPLNKIPDEEILAVEKSIKSLRRKHAKALEQDDDMFLHSKALYEVGAPVRELYKKRGYDAILYNNKVEGGLSYIAFDPTQIKSATGNRGTFDPNDPNITHFAGSASAPSRNRAATRLERQAAQVAYDKYGRPREESAGRPVSTFQGLGSLLSSPSDTYYTRGSR